MTADESARYLHLIRQDCPVPHETEKQKPANRLVRRNSLQVDLRGFVSFPSQIANFMVVQSRHVSALQLHPDKDRLRLTILDLRAAKMSYRQISLVLGIHWTRVQQIVKTST